MNFKNLACVCVLFANVLLAKTNHMPSLDFRAEKQIPILSKKCYKVILQNNIL